MKHALLCLLCAAGNAFAGASTTYGAAGTLPNGIVTPDVATGFRAFEDFTFDPSGKIVVCTAPAEFTRGNCEVNGRGNTGWRDMLSTIPAGRTFVGFRVANGRYGVRILEVYWK